MRLIKYTREYFRYACLERVADGKKDVYPCNSLHVRNRHYIFATLSVHADVERVIYLHGPTGRAVNVEIFETLFALRLDFGEMSTL